MRCIEYSKLIDQWCKISSIGTQKGMSWTSRSGVEGMPHFLVVSLMRIVMIVGWLGDDCTSCRAGNEVVPAAIQLTNASVPFFLPQSKPIFGWSRFSIKLCHFCVWGRQSKSTNRWFLYPRISGWFVHLGCLHLHHETEGDLPPERMSSGNLDIFNFQYVIEQFLNIRMAMSLHIGLFGTFTHIIYLLASVPSNETLRQWVDMEHIPFGKYIYIICMGLHIPL